MQHESGGEQFRPDGTVLVSPTHDRGVMQINDMWLPTAKKMGLNLDTEKDNIQFGIWLAQTHGLSQWTTYRKYCQGGNTS